MCLIIAKPVGVPYDDFLRESISAGFIANDDGAGFAYKQASKNRSEADGPLTHIHLSKGYMSCLSLLTDLNKLDIEPNDELIIHFRYATHGLINDKNCHPFIVSQDSDLLDETDIWVAEPVVAHNGVFHEYSKTLSRSSQHSDTYLFVKNRLSQPHFYNKVFGEVKDFDEDLVKVEIGGNKLALLHPKKYMQLIGEFILDKGVYFSNYGYKTNRNLNNILQREIDYDKFSYGYYD